MSRSKIVDAWFARYENPMKDVVQRIRALVLGADARIEECIKWQAPTFTYRGNLASFFPKSKQHASLMFHMGAKILGNHPRLEGSGGTSRVLKIGSVAEANAAKRELERIVKAWCAWRDAAEKPEPTTPTAMSGAKRRPLSATTRSKLAKPTRKAEAAKRTNAAKRTKKRASA
jgi:uncharacterized protein YdhG (YjbR/CyaY superfamily)